MSNTAQSTTAGDQTVPSPGQSVPLDPTSLKAGTPNQVTSTTDNVDAMLARMKNFKFTYADTAKLLAGSTGLAPGWRAQAQKDIQDTNQFVLHQLRQSNINAVGFDPNGDVLIQNSLTGETKAYNESMLSDLWASKGETAGAMAGAMAGARIGATGMAAGPEVGVPTTAVGTIIGGAIGAALGRGFDVVKNALDANYQVTTADTIAKMADAGVADLTLSALGISAHQLVKGVARFGKASGRGLSRSWDLFVSGNKKGAQDTLKNVFDLNDAQTIDIINKWENATGHKILSDEARQSGKLTPKDAKAAIQAVAETTPGAQNLVGQATHEAKSGGALLGSRIDQRAKDILDEASKLTNDHIDVVLQHKLNSYISDTKQYFENIKTTGTELMKDTPYRFSFKDTALVPSLEKSVKGIHNSALRKDFYHYMTRIRELGAQDVIDAAKKAKKPITKKLRQDALDATNPYRSFDNLLELRRTVNELRSDNRFKAFTNVEQLKASLASIDNEIEHAAMTHMPEGDAWLKQWRAANNEYHKMKVLQGNVLFKTLTNPRVNPERAVKAITQSMAYTDPSTFMQVLGKLPDRTRANVEGAVLKHLTEKNTVGFESGKQAINFPALAHDLDQVAFTQSSARNFKRSVKEFAAVFKNDPHLLAATGSVPLAKFQSYLTTDVTTRIKFELANKVFNMLLSRVPFSQKAGRVALVKNLATILDNPLKDRAITELTKALPEDPLLKTDLHRLAIEFAKQGSPEHYGKVPIYRVYRPGEFGKASVTKLGKGMLYYTNKEEALKVSKETGMALKEVMQLHKSIATPEDVRNLLGHAPTAEDLRSPDILNMLQNQDYAGIAEDNRVLLFKDN